MLSVPTRCLFTVGSRVETSRTPCIHLAQGKAGITFPELACGERVAQLRSREHRHDRSLSKATRAICRCDADHDVLSKLTPFCTIEDCALGDKLERETRQTELFRTSCALGLGGPCAV